MLNGIKVFVTGSSGFIGSHLVEALKDRGYAVYGYDIVNGDDILSKERLHFLVSSWRPNWLVHLAGQAFLKPSLENPQQDAMTNIIGTLNVLQAADLYRCGVIFTSSGAVYGNNYQYPEPISPYGLSKLTAERYCQFYHQLYNVHTVVFRLSSVYGPGRKTSINLIVDKALKSEIIQVTGSGSQTRDFTHVSDVVEAILMAVNNKFPSGIYDIGTGTAVSINALIQIIERLLNRKIKVKYVSAIEEDPKRNELNVSKAEIFGFKAKVSIVDGVKQLIGVD